MSNIDIKWICEFCGRTTSSKNGYFYHSNYCKKNPHRKIYKGGGYRRGAGRGKRGHYKGLYCMSTWELAWVVYQLEHGQKVEQCKEQFEYIMDNEVHHYIPDFIIDGVYYEIKNWHRPDTDFKVNQFPKDKTLILIEGKENEVFISYAKKKYGEKFWENLYEGYEKQSSKYDLLKARLDTLRVQRLKALSDSGIDFQSYGWKSEVYKKLGFRWDYIERNLPEFYSKCYKTSKIL